MNATAADLVPSLPENAPFTAEQRAYLNGFLAGLFSRHPAPAPVPDNATAAPRLASLLILFGSQTGTGERLAKRLAKMAGNRGFAPTVRDLAEFPLNQLPSEARVLIVASTFGDGEPPDNAKAFWGSLNDNSAPKLPQTRFSVCALGDSNYPKFCGFGKELDARLDALGAQRVHPRVDCDMDYEEDFSEWMNSVLNAFPDTGGSPPCASREAAEEKHTSPGIGVTTGDYDRNRPFAATLIASRKLTGEQSEKDVRHFEISIEGSGLSYEAGDAMGVYPSNCPDLVEEILRTLSVSGSEKVPGRDGAPVSLREALLTHYEITRIPLSLLQLLSQDSRDEALVRAAAPDANGALTKFLWGREIIDLLQQHPGLSLEPAEFVHLLKKLPPRLYSISSSPKAHPGQVHLTINILRYESLTRSRKGVCSTFLADRSKPGARVPVFLHTNPNFRPPSDPAAPMIMIGPGTGIAPFRAFLEERREAGAKGRNWLFFGDQRIATDFLYADELRRMQNDGLISRLDTSFSRDQAQKLYVQHRMREHSRELFSWLEAGAHLYVCGDAQRMANDVDLALHEIIQNAGQRTPEQSSAYVNQLKQEKRYQRDVY